MKDKVRVVWICSFSNSNVRNILDIHIPLWYKLLRIIKDKKSSFDIYDYAIWNTNAIREFENINEIELHVVFTHPMLRKGKQIFINRGVHYYAVNDSDNSLRAIVMNYLHAKKNRYEKTWNTIVSLVKEIEPDIIHLMGAENPDYSMSVLRLSGIPIITQLQTLLNDPAVNKYVHYAPSQLNSEKLVLKKTDYIGTESKVWSRVIREYIKKDALIVNTRLITAERMDLSQGEKEFDFVYFSSSLNKAIDLVVEAFAIAHKERPDLTLDIVGGYNEDEILKWKLKIIKLGLGNSVTFEGMLPTHDDVVLQVKKARFALLPLKVDLISSTIREAMWLGLPVVTTITQGTPLLNEKCETVLLSNIGDHKALAANIIKLANDPSLADKLRSNAVITVEELFGNNSSRAREWVKVYFACIDNYRNGIQLPEEVVNE